MTGAEQRVLVVDDESGIRALLKCALSIPSRQIFEADCAEIALELAAAHGPFDLVVSDVIMPGMDGVKLASELHDRGQASAFLLVSGFCEIEDFQERTDGVQPCGFLAKPFTVPDLLRAVRALLPEPAVRTASVRDHRARRALGRPRKPVDRATALRRASERLRRDAARCRAELEYASGLNRLLAKETERQWERLRAASEKLWRDRVIVEFCFAQLRER